MPWIAVHLPAHGSKTLRKKSACRQGILLQTFQEKTQIRKEGVSLLAISDVIEVNTHFQPIEYSS